MLAPHRFDTAHMITFILVGCLWLAWKLGQREKWLGWTYTALIIGTGVNLFTNRTVLLKGMRDGAVRADITLVPLLGCLSIGAAVCIFLWAAKLSASDSHFLAKAIAFIGAMSGILGAIQVFGGDFLGIYGVNPVKDVGASVGLWGNPGFRDNPCPDPSSCPLCPSLGLYSNHSGNCGLEVRDRCPCDGSGFGVLFLVDQGVVGNLDPGSRDYCFSSDGRPPELSTFGSPPCMEGHGMAMAQVSNRKISWRQVVACLGHISNIRMGTWDVQEAISDMGLSLISYRPYQGRGST